MGGGAEEMGWDGLMERLINGGCVRLEGGGDCVFSARGRAHEVVFCVLCDVVGLAGVARLWLSCLLWYGSEEGCQIFYFGGRVNLTGA